MIHLRLLPVPVQRGEVSLTNWREQHGEERRREEMGSRRGGSGRRKQMNEINDGGRGGSTLWFSPLGSLICLEFLWCLRIAPLLESCSERLSCRERHFSLTWDTDPHRLRLKRDLHRSRRQTQTRGPRLRETLQSHHRSMFPFGLDDLIIKSAQIHS